MRTNRAGLVKAAVNPAFFAFLPDRDSGKYNSKTLLNKVFYIGRRLRIVQMSYAVIVILIGSSYA
jgi:hypothetical protein